MGSSTTPRSRFVLLAHRDRAISRRCAASHHLDIEPLPAVASIDEALAAREIVWGTDNLFKTYQVSKGDADSAFRADDVVLVEGVYETGAQEQLYIEPNGMLAVADPKHGVTVWGSMQCPYYIHAALAALFDLPPERIRVVQMETGGGFGGKEEYPSIIAGHAALLAWKSGRPVKLIYGRTEDMTATTKRHPSRTVHRTAVTSDGHLRRHGYRFRDRWWRLLHAVSGRAVAWHHPCGGPIRLPECPVARARGRDQRGTARRLSWLWCAAEHLRARTTHGYGCRRDRPDAR